MEIVELLKMTADTTGSDLFITAAKKPYWRKLGKVSPVPDIPELTVEQVADFRQTVLLNEAERIFNETGNYDAGLTLEDGQRFRINFFLQQGKPGLVARPVPFGNELSFESLNLPKSIKDFAEIPRGLLLIVGTTGSGKSTTMASIVNHINNNYDRHIVTIEDPIEFVHHDNRSLITQREVGVDTSDFGNALRNVVRESPDVILIGEMRDLETMQTAVSAALTGHLVISTMHTSDAVQSIERIINHFPDHLRSQAADDLSLALNGIIAQRLIPRSDEKGMIPAVEILKTSPHIRSLVAGRKFKELEEAIKRGHEQGMETFTRAISDLYKQKKISLEDGTTFASNKEEFLLLVQGMESGIETFRTDIEDDDEGGVSMKQLLHAAVGNSGSDLLITAGCRPTLRFSGELTPLVVDHLKPSDTKRLLFSIMNPRQRAQFEEELEIDFALTVNIKRTKETKEMNAYRFRVNGFFQRGNVAIAIRVIPRDIPDPRTLGIPSAVMNLAKKKHGLVLITGPTGHGKSTTMASMINTINNTRACHIITVEDPIEYVHENIKAVVEQREVNADTKSFASALKYVLRQDPDVILVGEMRDTETISAALTAAETGHLVLATLHTNDAPQSVDRIVDSFPAHQQNQIRVQLSGSLLGVISQRLLPKKEGSGRIAAFEIMMGNSGVRKLIRDGKTHQIPSIMEIGAKDGMITMDKSLQELYAKGLIKREDMNNLLKSLPE